MENYKLFSVVCLRKVGRVYCWKDKQLLVIKNNNNIIASTRAQQIMLLHRYLFYGDEKQEAIVNRVLE